MDTHEAARKRMYEKHLVRRGISDPAVLDAMKSVRREEFVPPNMVDFAYEDSPLPIGEGQTISQPYIVALMVQALQLKPEDTVLDIGTGSGYAAAVLSRIARKVYTVERHKSLVKSAEAIFGKMGYDNIEVLHGDGTMGWPEYAPYNAIVVAAGGPEVPQPLVDQLVDGGRLVIPVGKTQSLQELVQVHRESEDKIVQNKLTEVRFVPLVGQAGWVENKEPMQ